MSLQVYKDNQPLLLENGDSIPSLEIAYHTYGQLNPKRNNVIWVCHALTASADAAEWWNGIIGEGRIFDTRRYFIICANILGSCYGSSGPLSVNPETGRKYYSAFPPVTIRDMVKAHIRLRKHLGIKRIYIGAGGSMGAYQLMEWAVAEPKLFQRQILMNTSARESAWGIAIHTAQRLAIEADSTWRNNSSNAGAKGLKAARAIGMLTYRNYDTFAKEQTDNENNKLDNYRSSSYIHYQGDKLVKRFNVYSYWLLTKSMDSHNLARRRRKIEIVLKSIKIKTLIIGMSSDILCPRTEQEFLARHLSNATLKIIDSSYGHDGFLVEWKKLTTAITRFLKK
jgi:homoserine O-acetyltransferase/O-succinyltransferase